MWQTCPSLQGFGLQGVVNSPGKIFFGSMSEIKYNEKSVYNNNNGTMISRRWFHLVSSWVLTCTILRSIPLVDFGEPQVWSHLLRTKIFLISLGCSEKVATFVIGAPPLLPGTLTHPQRDLPFIFLWNFTEQMEWVAIIKFSLKVINYLVDNVQTFAKLWKSYCFLHITQLPEHNVLILNNIMYSELRYKYM